MGNKVIKNETPIVETIVAKTKGRPVNPESKNAKFNERKAAGLVKRTGRPMNPNSAAAIKRAEREALLAAGVVVKRGRKKVDVVSAEVVKPKAKVKVKKVETIELTPEVVNDVNVISEIEVLES